METEEVYGEGLECQVLQTQPRNHLTRQGGHISPGRRLPLGLGGRKGIVQVTFPGMAIPEGPAPCQDQPRAPGYARLQTLDPHQCAGTSLPPWNFNESWRAKSKKGAQAWLPSISTRITSLRMFKVVPRTRMEKRKVQMGSMYLYSGCRRTGRQS